MDGPRLRQSLDAVRAAALDRRRITTATHPFYAYPARFSPAFAAAAIEAFSRPGDLVLDPYMGGGTSVVEALRLGRRAVGCDLNELAVFVARVKTTRLTAAECRAVADWEARVVPRLSYRNYAPPPDELRLTRNLSIPRARFLKKLIQLALWSIDDLPTRPAREFARCAVLRAGQWALNGKKTRTSLGEFRIRLARLTREMLAAVREAGPDLARPNEAARRRLIHGDAADLASAKPFARGGLADLVVTSPPYPKIHVLYHRWQVDGRRETPAPYWISQSNDGQGAAYYNFADRRSGAMDAYFAESLETLNGIRRVMRTGAYIVQMLAFGEPHVHLPRYVANMDAAGFAEVMPNDQAEDEQETRIWRNVPNRQWHAAIRGHTSSSREVVLIHRAM